MSKPVLPDVYFDILDGGLGLLPGSAEGVFAIIGTATSGQDNEIVTITDPKDAKEHFTSGKLVDAIMDAFANGARKVLAVKVANESAGVIGTMHSDKTGTGDMSAQGSPLNDYEVVVKITGDGGLNQAQFKYSLHGLNGEFSDPITVPADGNYELMDGNQSTGITLVFTEDANNPGNSFKTGDTWWFSTYAPVTSLSKVLDALDALIESPYLFEWVYVAGPSDSSTWTALNTEAENAAQNKYKFFHVVCEPRDQGENETIEEYVNALVSEANGLELKRTSVVITPVKLVDMDSGQTVTRNVAGCYVGRLASIPVQRSAGRVADGPLTNVLDLADGWKAGHISNLDQAGYVTARRYEGQGGVYITNAMTLAGATSDFKYVELRRVMDKACRLVRAAGLRSEHNEASEEGLAGLKADCQHPLDLMRANKEIMAGIVEIPEGQDVFGTETVKVKVRIQPIAIMRWIEIEIGFQNPYSHA